MKLSLAILSTFALIGAFPGGADEVLPSRFNFDRYKAMVDRSPFAVATAVALPDATPDFAKDLYIANAAHSTEGDMVTLMSSADHNFKKYLTTREPVDGYNIAQIEWSADVGKTKVTISKAGQFATLTFNQSLLSQSAPAGRPVASRPPLTLPVIPSPGANQASGADARGAIDRNPKTASAPRSNVAAGSSDDSAPVPAVPVSRPGITVPKPLGRSHELSDKEPSG